MRLFIAAFGVVAFGAGTVGAFKDKNGNAVAFSTLVVVGALALFIAAVGKWPTKFGPDGVEMSTVALHSRAVDAFLENPTDVNRKMLVMADKELKSLFRLS